MDAASPRSPVAAPPAGADRPADPSRPRRARFVTRLFHPFLRLGRGFAGALEGLRRLVAFTLITLATGIQKRTVATQVIHPLVREQIYRTGFALLPLVGILGFGLGFIIVGQVLLILIQHGQAKLFSTLMAPLIIREAAPLAASLIVLMRVGTAMVTHLGTARATGEVEALEALGIDPIHLLVVPRVVGLTLSVVALTLYLALSSLLGGYLMGFVHGSALTLDQYFGGVMQALNWLDFPLLGLKTLLLGAGNALVICYRGLAEPLRLEQVGDVTARTVAHCLLLSVAIDGLFLIPNLFL